MKEIKLNQNVSIYIDTIKNYNADLLKRELKKNFEFSYGDENSDLLLSGKQSVLAIDFGEINYVKNECISIIKKITNNIGSNPFYNKNWIYINDNATKDVFFHEHSQNKDISILKNEWVYTFYAQMPNNLTGDDGYLLFKTEDGLIHKILPIEGEVVLFPANLLHRPELSPNTTKERIVLAGVYSAVDMEKSYLKSNKTIF